MSTNSRWKNLANFIGFTTFASVVYGITHDLVTAQVSKEYFLPPHHPILIETQSPIVLALVWGVVATWWAGLALGALIGLANTLGKPAPLEWKLIRRWTAIGMVGIWFTAMLLMIAFLNLPQNAVVRANVAPIESNSIVAVSIAHGWSYFATTALAVILTIWIFIRRSELEHTSA